MPRNATNAAELLRGEIFDSIRASPIDPAYLHRELAQDGKTLQQSRALQLVVDLVPRLYKPEQPARSQSDLFDYT
jgi:hypothetical protein